MSGRLLSQRASLLARSGAYQRALHIHTFARNGLLRSNSRTATFKQRQWPLGSNSIHNVPAVRSISFARVLPQLALKLVRIPALFGGAMIAGIAYLQYQATRKHFLSYTGSSNLRQRLETMPSMPLREVEMQSQERLVPYSTVGGEYLVRLDEDGRRPRMRQKRRNGYKASCGGARSLREKAKEEDLVQSHQIRRKQQLEPQQSPEQLLDMTNLPKMTRDLENRLQKMIR